MNELLKSNVGIFFKMSMK